MNTITCPPKTKHGWVKECHEETLLKRGRRTAFYYESVRGNCFGSDPSLLLSERLFRWFEVVISGLMVYFVFCRGTRHLLRLCFIYYLFCFSFLQQSVVVPESVGGDDASLQPPCLTKTNWRYHFLFVCFYFLSLLPVLSWCLRHLRPVRQALGAHVDVLLQRPAHLPHHAQLPHRGREPIHLAAAAIHPWSTAVPPRPLQVEQVCLPVRHRPRWVMRMMMMKQTGSQNNLLKFAK